LYSLPRIIRMMKLRRMRWAVHVAWMKQRNTRSYEYVAWMKRRNTRSYEYSSVSFMRHALLISFSLTSSS
jgi:hypothetical protein